MTEISDRPIYLYNTLTRSKELFRPLNPPRVGIYNCGPTVYKDIHVGNFRSFIATDWLRRMLEYNGYEVFLVRNITDVGHLHDVDDERSGEDKMEHQARTTGHSAYAIAAYYTQQYLADAAELNIPPAQLIPRAADHMPDMQEMTAKPIGKGVPYAAHGNVNYDVGRFRGYGRLSGNAV